MRISDWSSDVCSSDLVRRSSFALPLRSRSPSSGMPRAASPAARIRRPCGGAGPWRTWRSFRSPGWSASIPPSPWTRPPGRRSRRFGRPSRRRAHSARLRAVDRDRTMSSHFLPEQLSDLSPALQVIAGGDPLALVLLGGSDASANAVLARYAVVPSLGNPRVLLPLDAGTAALATALTQYAAGAPSPLFRAAALGLRRSEA